MMEYIPGLEKVPAAESAISYIDGERGILEYRGIRIEELAEKSNFEETTYLLLNGNLPTQTELGAMRAKMRASRRLSPALIDMIRCFPREAHPMAELQTAAAAMGMSMKRGALKTEATRYECALEFIAKFATVIAATHRSREGKEIIDPDPTLDPATDFLHMLTGEKPDPFGAHIMDVCLVLHADHTMNASTFTMRVTASTLPEPAMAVAAAVGSLSGPLHGGANEAVLVMLEEIGTAARVTPWLEEKLATKGKIMGLGHRVYKTKDPRASHLQTLAHELFGRIGTSKYYDVAAELERQALEKLGPKGIYPNVDFYSGIVYNKLGIPSHLFTPIFALSRISGWMAHWLEQMRANRLFRPTQVYTGGHDLAYTPIAEREPSAKTV